MPMAFNGFQPPKEWDTPMQGGMPQLSDPSLTAPVPQRGGGLFHNFNAPGGFASKLGLLADALDGGNTFANAQQQPIENDFKRRQLELQGQIANTRADTEPASIKALRAAGIDPASPYGQSLIAGNLNRPIIVGSPETSQMVLGGGFGAPGATAGPPKPNDAAIARLRANPSEAAMFDQQFGPGASAAILGGR